MHLASLSKQSTDLVLLFERKNINSTDIERKIRNVLVDNTE